MEVNTMAQANINICMDADLKQSFERLCKEVVDSFYSEANLGELKRRLADLDAGKGTEHELIEVDE